jgi:hypothetical protein
MLPKMLNQFKVLSISYWKLLEQTKQAFKLILEINTNFYVALMTVEFVMDCLRSRFNNDGHSIKFLKQPKVFLQKLQMVFHCLNNTRKYALIQIKKYFFYKLEYCD